VLAACRADLGLNSGFRGSGRRFEVNNADEARRSATSRRMSRSGTPPA